MFHTYLPSSKFEEKFVCIFEVILLSASSISQMPDELVYKLQEVRYTSVPIYSNVISPESETKLSSGDIRSTTGKFPSILIVLVSVVFIFLALSLTVA